MYCRNISIALLLLCLLLLPPAPRVAAQSCSFSSVFLTPWYYIVFGPDYPLRDDPYWIAGDYFNYTVTISSASSGVEVHWYDVSGVYQGLLVTLSDGADYTIAVHTSALAIVSTSPFTAGVCAPAPTATPIPPTLTPTNTSIPPTPTNTPIPPTLTPTNTPIPPTPTSTGVPPTVTPFISPTLTPETIVTATPIPTPTPDILVERANQSFQLDIFFGSIGIGLLLLMLFWKR